MFSFGVPLLIFVSMRKVAKKSWRVKIKKNYKPRLSIIIPTYNEESVILLKLKNLIKIKYPRDLMQVIIVDSGSKDNTVSMINNFLKQNPKLKIQVLVDYKEKGKAAALNFALKKCDGEVIITSDADSFWPSDILEKALPFLADPNVGAVSGPKLLLNPQQSWVTKREDMYMDLHNQVKLGESKIHSTLFFEGGFAAYKKKLLDSFDPYSTGSDDSGTIIRIIEKNFRAILVPKARFYSAFPLSWKEKINIKIRRANQLVRVFVTYSTLLFRKKIKNKSRKVVIQDILLYLVNPILFFVFLVTTFLLIFQFPFLALLFLLFIVPTMRDTVFEVIQSYLILLLAISSIALGRKFTFWNRPKDRILITHEILRRKKLI